MSDNYAILLAGGLGSRMGSSLPKQFLSLGGREILAWSLMAFDASPGIRGILLGCHADYIDRARSIVAREKLGKVIEIVPGGPTRQDSAYRCLTAMNFDGEDVVLIHDAARPFITANMISESIDAARSHGAAGLYCPATDTITEIHGGLVRSIPDRRFLYHAQTPQSFRYGLIRQAHERARERGIPDSSDDIALVLEAGHPVAAIEGHRHNIKITGDKDLLFAEILAGEIV